MATTDKEKEEIHELLKQGIKITDIADQLGISRETIRKIKNAPLPDGKKTDLSKFNESFEVAGETVTAEELLKAVGSLAPKILKERLDAGQLVLEICAGKAVAAGISLDEYLRYLITLPEQVLQTQADNQAITVLNQQLQNMLDQHIDSVAITRAVDRVMARVLEHGTNRINIDVIFAYGHFLQQLRTEDPKFFNIMKTLALQPIPVMNSNPT